MKTGVKITNRSNQGDFASQRALLVNCLSICDLRLILQKSDLISLPLDDVMPQKIQCHQK